MSFGLCHFFCSDSDHKMEDELLKLLRQTKEAGGSASLTFTTRDGKMKAKLEVELDPPAPASPSSTPPPPTTSPAPGRGRRRRKGAAAKVKAKARAALHQATRAAATQPPPVSGDASVALEAPAPHQQHHPPLRHPPHLLLSPSPSSGRRRVMSVGRPSRWPEPLGSLNLDGPPPSPPSFPPPPPPPPSPPPSSRPLARTALRVRSVNLRDFGGSDEGLANLAEHFHAVPFESLVSREFSRIFFQFHFSISGHFHFTFHSRSRFQGILISLFISRKE